MLLVQNRRLVVAACVIFFCQILAASGLRLRAVEGNGMVVSQNAPSSRKIVVIVEDDAGQLLNAVTVRFRLPADGPSGHFASGLSSESVLTSTDGRATVIGIVWNNQPGRLLLGVSAALQGDTAELEIPVEIGGKQSGKEPAMTATDRPPSSGMRKKWLILAATVGGAATLGVLFSMRGPSNPAAPVLQPPVVVAPVPPVVGIPVIGIGVPAN